jgi:hypothetical protein
MRRFLAAGLAAALAMPAAALAQGTPTSAAPPPGLLLAQVDDSDLAEEETLEQLKEEEFDKESWSMGSAIGLSLVPGAGWGLVYAEKNAQATVPILLSAAGYVMAGLYFAGVFDESSKRVCKYKPTSEVLSAESVTSSTNDTSSFSPCDVGTAAGFNQAVDPRSERGEQFFATQDAYERVTVGEDFDGKDTAVIIAISTYAITTLVGAVWAASTVADHNDRLRKDIESTVDAGSGISPVIAYDGENGLFGAAWRF